MFYLVVLFSVKEFKIEEDFVSLEENTHLRPHKHDLLRCLGFSGKWVTSQFDLQVRKLKGIKCLFNCD